MVENEKIQIQHTSAGSCECILSGSNASRDFGAGFEASNYNNNVNNNLP